MIYHITKSHDWLSQKDSDAFSAADLQREGFIHCCTKEQVPDVLERYFNGQKDLVVLHINEEKLSSPLKYEPSTNNEEFPHVYGPINKSAVVEVRDIA
jgi:uncharacterized protein (DUF952 family)